MSLLNFTSSFRVLNGNFHKIRLITSVINPKSLFAFHVSFYTSVDGDCKSF